MYLCSHRLRHADMARMKKNIKKIWDPLRKKEVALTPEEDVRQWFISRLHSLIGVPMHMMMSEVGFSIGDKKLRADIVVYGRNASPVAVVECKRPDIELDQAVLDQAVVYNMVLNVRYIFITNGRSTFVCRRETGAGCLRYVFVAEMPTWQDMA